MTALQITCDNCGAKYKLPASFDKPQAKCQKCGSVIDVARQRAAAAGGGAAAGSSPAAKPATPAAAKPAAAARPAQDRSKPAAAASPAARPARAGKAAAERVNKDDKPAAGKRGDGKRGGRERGEASAKKAGNQLPLLALAGGVLVVVVVAALMLRGDDKPAKADGSKTAQAADAASTSQAGGAGQATPPATAPAAKEPTPPAAAGEAQAEPTKPAETPVPPPATEPAKPSTPPPSTPVDTAANERDPSKPWLNMRNPPDGLDQVTDAKTYAEVSWPEAIAQDKKQEARELAERAKESGGPGLRATNKLKSAEFEFAALFAIVEQLRLLDYRNNEDAMLGLALNKVLEEILFEINTRYAAVTAEEAITPAKAEWNTRTVQAWIGLLNRYTDEEIFRKERSARRAKAAEKDR